MEENNSKYFLVVIAIVALVAIVSLFMLSNTQSVQLQKTETTKSDLAGQAIGTASSSDFEFTAQENAAQIRILTITNKDLVLNLKLYPSPNLWGYDGSPMGYIWGDDAQTLDGKIYLEGDACFGASSVTECKDARFLISAGDKKDGHLIKIKKIDMADKKISFRDSTAGCDTNDKSFKLGYGEYYALCGGAGTIYLAINEKSIKFKELGDGYAVDSSYVDLQTRKKNFVRFYNKNQGQIEGDNGIQNAIFEGISFLK